MIESYYHWRIVNDVPKFLFTSNMPSILLECKFRFVPFGRSDVCPNIASLCKICLWFIYVKSQPIFIFAVPIKMFPRRFVCLQTPLKHCFTSNNFTCTWNSLWSIRNVCYTVLRLLWNFTSSIAECRIRHQPINDRPMICPIDVDEKLVMLLALALNRFHAYFGAVKCIAFEKNCRHEGKFLFLRVDLITTLDVWILLCECF